MISRTRFPRISSKIATRSVLGRMFMVVTNVLCLFINIIQPVHLSSRVSDPLGWVDEEAQLIYLAQKYMNSELERLETLKDYQKGLIQHATLYKSEDDLAFNPLAIYKAIKHLTKDLAQIEESMRDNSYDDTIGKLFGKIQDTLPAEGHLYEEIRRLIQIQRLYNLPVIDMVEGRLGPNVTVEPALTTQDCFYIGKTCTQKHDHEAAIDWLNGCRNIFDEDLYHRQVSKIILHSALFEENYSLACKMTKAYLKKDGNERVLHDILMILSLRMGRWLSIHQYMLWESFNVCAGDYDHEWPYRPMKCRYNHHNSPFLTIAPLKEEIIMTTPLISIFREALYDSEIEQLKKDVYPNMTPGSVLNKKGRDVVEPRYFPCNRYHMPEFDVNYKGLYKRLEDISALMHTETKTLHVVYYTPGGFIRVHSDFSSPKNPAVIQGGHRIAQAVLYLSDVTLGGETVFPRTKVKITPVKGSIAMWTNMRVDGEEEQFSYHAGCPVVVGEKIIATQWFRSKKQDRWITKPEDKLTPEIIEREKFDLDIKRSKK